MVLNLNKKHAFASLTMSDIQYLIKKRLDKHAILYLHIKYETRHENRDRLSPLEMG